MRQSLAAISRGKARQLKTKSYQLPLPSEVAFKRKNGAPLTGKRVFSVKYGAVYNCAHGASNRA